MIGARRREIFAFNAKSVLLVVCQFDEGAACAPSTPSNLINVSLTKFSGEERNLISSNALHSNCES